MRTEQHSIATFGAVSRIRMVSSTTSFFDVCHALFLLFVLTSAGWASIDRSDKLLPEILLLFLNGTLCIVGQLSSVRRGQPLRYVSFLFAFLFMAVAPLYQIGLSNSQIFFEDSILLRACSCALAFTLAGLVTHKIRVSLDGAQSISKANDTAATRSAATFHKYLRLAIVVLMLAVICLIMFGDVLFTNRATFQETVESNLDGPIAALLFGIIMSMPFYGAIIGLGSSAKSRQWGWSIVFGLLLVLSLVINNIFITARFKIIGNAIFAVAYLAGATRVRLMVVVVISGMILAPAFNIFRTADSGGEAWTGRGFLADTYVSMDYDAFQMLCFGIKTVDQAGLTLGNNIAGAALFFVPRVLWDAKPEPSSWVIAKIMGFMGTNNLSTPLMAEGYLAFGFAGALLLSIVYWIFIGWIEKRALDRASMLFVIECTLAGLLLIVLRGTLMIGVAYSVGSLIAAVVPWKIFRGSVRPVELRHA
jgi:hypothetical protein